MVNNMNPIAQKILLSPIFLLGLFLLLLNDFFLKYQFHNFLTGKLSDFAGLFIFPLFFAAFLPKRKVEIYFLTGVLFIFWKSPVSQGLIDFWNSLKIFRIGRVVDFTDLFALFVLPISYFFFIYKAQNKLIYLTNRIKQIEVLIVILIAVFAFTATTLKNERSAWFDKNYTFNGKKEDLEEKLKTLPDLRRISLKSESEVLSNIVPNEKIDPDEYWLRFEIIQKFCESESLRFLIWVNEIDGKTTLRFGNVEFMCEEQLTENQKQKIFRIFEKKIAIPLELMLQSDTKVDFDIENPKDEEGNKTSSPRP